MVACTLHTECEAQFDDTWVCSPFQVLQSDGDKASKGKYCASEDTCAQESIVDVG